MANLKPTCIVSEWKSNRTTLGHTLQTTKSHQQPPILPQNRLAASCPENLLLSMASCSASSPSYLVDVHRPNNRHVIPSGILSALRPWADKHDKFGGYSPPTHHLGLEPGWGVEPVLGCDKHHNSYQYFWCVWILALCTYICDISTYVCKFWNGYVCTL